MTDDVRNNTHTEALIQAHSLLVQV
jgi:hypothetical protein